MPRETAQSSTGWNDNFTYLEKRQQNKLNGERQSPTASEFLPVTRYRTIHLCAPLWCSSGRNLLYYLQRTEVTAGLVRCHVTHTLSVETKECSLHLKQGKIVPHTVIQFTQPVPFISWYGSVPGPRPIPMWLSGGRKTACRRLPLPIV